MNIVLVASTVRVFNSHWRSGSYCDFSRTTMAMHTLCSEVSAYWN